MYQFIENMKSEKAFFFYFARVALHAILKSMGIQKGDEVILQSFTCSQVAAPITRLEAIPVYVDIDLNTYNIDLDKIEEKITKKTKVIIVQHTYGIPVNMDIICEIAQRHSLMIIEDCCHAFGSKFNNREVGTFGDAAFYSFGWHKPVVLGMGGVAIVNNPKLRIEVIKNYKIFVSPSFIEFFILYAQYIAYDLLVKPSHFMIFRDIYRSDQDPPHHR